MLICHGQQDDYVPVQMSIELHDAKKHGLARLYLAPNAAHAEALVNNPAEYDQRVGAFLEEIGL
jgi:hypothetical protein